MVITSIGKNLKNLRIAKKLSQQDLANKVGINRSMITQIERGTKSLSLLLSQELAQVLNCSIEDFLK